MLRQRSKYASHHQCSSKPRRSHPTQHAFKFYEPSPCSSSLMRKTGHDASVDISQAIISSNFKEWNSTKLHNPHFCFSLLSFLNSLLFLLNSFRSNNDSLPRAAVRNAHLCACSFLSLNGARLRASESAIRLASSSAPRIHFPTLSQKATHTHTVTDSPKLSLHKSSQRIRWLILLLVLV